MIFRRLHMVVMLINSILSVMLAVVEDASTDQRFKRVVSSIIAEPHSRPYTALLTRHGENICGAALVNRPPYHHTALETGSSDILLTAAHCFVTVGPTDWYSEEPPQFLIDHREFSAIFGKYNSSGYEDTQVEVKFSNIIIHQDFAQHETHLSNDIAIVKLEQPVTFSSIIKPIALTNYKLAEVTNCSIAGWGRHTDIPESQDPNTVLSILYLQDMKTKRDNHEIEVQDWNETTVPFSHTRFTDVAFFLESNWIMEAFQDIEKPFMWFAALSKYSNSVTHDPRRKYHLQNIEEMVKGYNFGLPEEYNREIILPKYNHADYVNLWFDKGIAEKILRIEYTGIEIKNLIGYVERNDPYQCTIDCYMWNQNRPCLFLSETNRCYFMSWPKWSERAGTGFKVLGIKVIEKSRRRKSMVKPFVFKTTENASIRDDGWNISVSVKGQEHYFCHGMLSSIDATVYDQVDVSKQCLCELWTAYNTTQSILTAVIDDAVHTSGLDISQPGCLPRAEGSARLVLKTPIPITMTKITSLNTEKFLRTTPTLRVYNPFSGTFRVDPGTQPSIILLSSSKQSGKECYGVLINESAFSPTGRKTKSHYILTTESCVAMNQNHVDSATAGKYFLNIGSAYRAHSDKQTQLHFNEDPKLRDFVLLEFEMPFVFNKHIKPVAFMDPWSLPPKFPLFSFSYDAACNIDPMKPLNEIPMKLDQLYKSTDIFAERQFYISNNHSCHKQRIDNHGEPLFAYNSDKDTYFLLGLNSGATNQSNKFIDNFKSVWPYLPWIGETVKKTIAERECLQFDNC